MAVATIVINDEDEEEDGCITIAVLSDEPNPNMDRLAYRLAAKAVVDLQAILKEYAEVDLDLNTYH